MILLLKLQFVLRFNVILIFPFKPFIHDSFDIFPGSNLFKVVNPLACRIGIHPP